jgi:hypothetical protein
MSAFQRALPWVNALALVIFILVIQGAHRTLKTTVQGHTATLDKPMLEAVVFPGVPAAFSARWHKATQGTALTPQDHLWLILHITNSGRHQVRDIAADLVLLSAISAIYSGSETLWRSPAMVAESTG